VETIRTSAAVSLNAASELGGRRLQEALLSVEIPCLEGELPYGLRFITVTHTKTEANRSDVTSDRKRTARPGGGAGRPRSLTTDEVITAAIDIADAEGLEGLSMPKLAKRLNVGTMTLYGYVENRQDLHDKIAASILADLQLRELPDWRASMVAFFVDFREAALDHPSLGSLLARGRITIPAVFDILEALCRSATGDGLTIEQSFRTFYGALTYTLGFVLWEIPRAHLQPKSAYRAQWVDLLSQLDPADHPLMTEAATTAVAPTVVSTDQFMWGLQQLIGVDSDPTRSTSGRPGS
jgi:AcrR family transcriptional regulator